jgi:N-hydroxyarylamine O-acetyltransferase
LIQEVKEGKSDWQLGYLFTLNHRTMHEFEEMCHYHQTSTVTNFTKRRLCTIPTKPGRVTLTDTKLKMEENGKVTETAVRSEEAFLGYLKKYFDLEFEY